MSANLLGYIVKRLLLMIPTLLGILLVTFTLVQFVPGGPVEQMVQMLKGDHSATGIAVPGGLPQEMLAKPRGYTAVVLG